MRISDWSSDVCSSDLLPQAYPSPSFSDLRRHHLNQCNDIAECLLLFLYSVHRPPHPSSPECSLYASIRPRPDAFARSEEHTSELQSLMRISYAVFCLKKKKQSNPNTIKSI